LEAGTRRRFEEMAVDPVCGMEVEPAEAPATASHGGEKYYFCAESCRDRFVNEPARFIQAPGADWAPLSKKEGFLKRLFSSR